MLFVRKAWLSAVGAVIALAAFGCGNGGTGTSSASGAGGAGVGGGAASSTVTSSASSTSSSIAGGGMGGGAPNPTTTTSSGSSIVYAPSGFACSGSMPSLAHDVVPITSASCTNGAACHAALHTANGVNGMFVDRLAEECSDNRLMVDPGNPEGSYVIHKITSHNLCANQPSMPQTGPALAAAQIQVIYDWICEGAPNN